MPGYDDVTGLAQKPSAMWGNRTIAGNEVPATSSLTRADGLTGDIADIAWSIRSAIAKFETFADGIVQVASGKTGMSLNTLQGHDRGNLAYEHWKFFITVT